MTSRQSLTARLALPILLPPPVAALSIALLLLVGAAPAAGVFPSSINVSDSVTESNSGRLELIIDPTGFDKTTVVIYAEGPPGQGEVLARASLDGGHTFSAPVNLSNTPGDSFKPRVRSLGADILVAWVDDFCPGGFQGSYVPLGGVLTLFKCVYTARSVDGGRTWGPAQQLTDGSRDALNIMPDASDQGFAFTWQEDPLGLQPGEGEGPGEGGSGARTSPGTDVYYSALPTASFRAGIAFPGAVEVSDNLATTMGAPAASRPQVRVVGGTAFLAYEETKGMGGGGKTIVWHSFPLMSPPTADGGAVLSDLSENSRRVRIIAQGPSAAGPAGTLAVVLWRQGKGTQGAPADILMRRSVGGFGAASFQPAVNLTSPALSDPTDLLKFDNARAHRAVLRGDRLVFAYTYTPDDGAAQIQAANYNVFVRLSEDGGQSWGPAMDLSGLRNLTFNAGEPRLIGTPATVPTGDPADTRNPEVFFVAWGTETNEPDPLRLDLFVRQSVNGSRSFLPGVTLAAGPGSQFESQIRATADGRTLCAVWLDDTTGDHDVLFACGQGFTPSAVEVPALGAIASAVLALALAMLALLALRRG